jgi:hypothetical protein
MNDYDSGFADFLNGPDGLNSNLSWNELEASFQQLHRKKHRKLISALGVDDAMAVSEGSYTRA